MSFTLSHVHIVATTTGLLYLAVKDALTYRIENKTWLAAPPLIALNLLITPPTPASFGTSLAICALALALWATRTVGGADAKGLILLSWIIPATTLGPTTHQPLLYGLLVSLLTVLVIQRNRSKPFPFFLLLSPTTLGFWFLLANL